MKHSIRVKLALIIMGLMSGLILLICVFNVLFLEKYYMKVKESTLMNNFLAVSRDYIVDYCSFLC